MNLTISYARLAHSQNKDREVWRPLAIRTFPGVFLQRLMSRISIKFLHSRFQGLTTTLPLCMPIILINYSLFAQMAYRRQDFCKAMSCLDKVDLPLDSDPKVFQPESLHRCPRGRAMDSPLPRAILQYKDSRLIVFI